MGFSEQGAESYTTLIKYEYETAYLLFCYFVI